MGWARAGVTGYQALNISYGGDNWGGLEANNENCLLDGSVHDDRWWFAVGSFGNFNSGIPGPDDTVVQEVELWVEPGPPVLTPDPLFQSGMVLQAGRDNAVWGVVLGGAGTGTLALHQAGQLVWEGNLAVGDEGDWTVAIPAEHCQQGTGYTITIQAEVTTPVLLDDISFGEVWVCSGQSNMEFKMFGILNSEEEMATSANFTSVRFAKVEYMPVGEEMSHLWGGLALPWSSPAQQDRLAQISAVCFLYGRALAAELGVPVGLVETSWGGTRVEAWSPQSGLAECGVPPSPDLGQGVPNEDSRLYNGMVAPLTRLTIAGAVWYQGEANVYYNTDLYSCTFPQVCHHNFSLFDLLSPQMIASWRAAWAANTAGATDPTFPFGFVQLGTWNEQVCIFALYFA